MTNEFDIIDELRVIINDDNKTIAYFTFSSQMRPSLKEFRILDQRSGIFVDQSHHSLITVLGKKYISYLERFFPLENLAKQHRRNMLLNATLFLQRDFHMKSGMRNLIEAFYDSVLNNSPHPMPYGQILSLSKIMDSKLV